jgi:hypothetical protein
MEVSQSAPDSQSVIAASILPGKPEVADLRERKNGDGHASVESTPESGLLVRYCTLCTKQIPEERVVRNSHTCCAEHQQEERRQRRAYKAMKSCRLCGRTAKRKRAPASEVAQEDLEAVRRGHN